MCCSLQPRAAVRRAAGFPHGAKKRKCAAKAIDDIGGIDGNDSIERCHGIEFHFKSKHSPRKLWAALIDVAQVSREEARPPESTCASMPSTA